MEYTEKLCFKLYLGQLQIIKDFLNPRFGKSINLYDKKIGTFHIFRSIHSNLNFLYETYEISSFAVFATLARMIIDSYSIFYIITSHLSDDEQRLRYYLLFIGSLDGRIKTTIDFAQSVNNIPKEVLKENDVMFRHDRSVIQNFTEKIYAEKLDILVQDSVIKTTNWKFPSSIPAGNKKSYSWQELYQIAKIPKNFAKAIQSHFSEFSHGLALSILYTEEKNSSKESIAAVINILQTLMGKIMLNTYSEELKDTSIERNFIDICNHHWDTWK